jgi:UDP-N-acetylmuramate--alanine ligase
VGLDFAAIVAGVAAFRGVHRRFERLGSWHGATVVDDYAHHPTEVAATLEAARQAYRGRRLIAIFQPHLYSRTRQLADAFGRSLLGAETAIVTGIYGSREQPEPGVSGELVADAARAAGHRDVTFVEQWRDLPAHLAERVAAGDVILTLGAGDIVRLAELLVAEAPP